MARFIRTPSALSSVLPNIQAAQAVALDTEFHTEGHYYPRLMLIQLRIDDQEPLLIDALAELDLVPLGQALAEAQLYVHGGQSDLQLLYRITGSLPQKVFDTQVAAGFVGQGYPIRLQELLRLNLGLRLNKTETLSDWSQRPLTPLQIQYASEDVLHLHALVHSLQTKLQERGYTEMMTACMQEQVDQTIRADDVSRAWRSLPGAHLLDEQERTVLQILAAWREQTARERDQPRHNVLNDTLLVDLSRRQPTTVDGLRANRRMPSQVLRRDGETILRCIKQGLSASSAPPPLFQQSRLWLDLVRVASRVAEQESGVSSELIFQDGVLEQLAATGTMTGWRRIVIGNSFFDFIQGKIGISIDGRWRGIKVDQNT